MPSMFGGQAEAKYRVLPNHSDDHEHVILIHDRSNLLQRRSFIVPAQVSSLSCALLPSGRVQSYSRRRDSILVLSNPTFDATH
jgi:hypothetical protein